MPRQALLSVGVHGSGLLLRLVFLLVLLKISTAYVMGQYGLLASIEAVSLYAAGLEFHTFTARRYTRAPTHLRLCFLIRHHKALMLFTVPAAGLMAVMGEGVLEVGLTKLQTAGLVTIVMCGAVALEAGRYLVLLEQPASSVILGFLRTAAWMPLALAGMAFGIDELDMIVSTWAGMSLMAVILSLWLLRAHLGSHVRVRLRYLRAGAQTAKTYYAIASITALQSNIERFMLQFLLGASAVGIFSFFQTLANTLMALLQSAVLNLSLPIILREFQQKSATRFDVLRGNMRRCLLLGILMGLALFAFSWVLIHLMDKPAYVENLWVLVPLLLAQIAMGWTQPIHLALYAAHHDRPLIVLTIATLLTSVAANGVFIGWWNIQGATATVLTIGLGISGVRLHLLNRFRTAGAL